VNNEGERDRRGVHATTKMAKAINGRKETAGDEIVKKIAAGAVEKKKKWPRCCSAVSKAGSAERKISHRRKKAKENRKKGKNVW